MAPVLYITTDNIRAAIGHTPQAIADLQIIDAMVEEQLLVELMSVYPDHAILHAAQTASPTPEQVGLYRILKLYLQWQGAVCMMPALQFLAPQKISDTSFEVQKFMKDDLQESIDRITGQRDKYAGILQVAAGLGSAETGLFSHISVASPTFDPVTNDGA